MRGYSGAEMTLPVEPVQDWEGSGATRLTPRSLQPEAMELMAELPGSRDRRDP